MTVGLDMEDGCMAIRLYMLVVTSKRLNSIPRMEHFRRRVYSYVLPHSRGFRAEGFRWDEILGSGLSQSWLNINRPPYLLRFYLIS